MVLVIPWRSYLEALFNSSSLRCSLRVFFSHHCNRIAGWSNGSSSNGGSHAYRFPLYPNDTQQDHSARQSSSGHGF